MTTLPWRARLATWPGSPASLAAALVLATAAVSSAGCQNQPAGRSAAAPRAALAGVSPSGPVAPPFAFEWTGGDPDAVYRVSVFDPAERLLFSWDTRSSRVDPPRDLDPYFKIGGSFLWKVAEMEQPDRPARETPLVSFTLQEIPRP